MHNVFIKSVPNSVDFYEVFKSIIINSLFHPYKEGCSVAYESQTEKGANTQAIASTRVNHEFGFMSTQSDK